MSRVARMSLKEILDQIEPMLAKQNIGYIFNDGEIAKEFLENYADIIEDSEKVEIALLEYEQHIDKEKLVLLLLFSYKENMLKIANELERLKQGKTNFDENRRMVEMLKLQKELEKQGEESWKLINLSKGIKQFLTAYYYDEFENRYKVILIGAKEIISTKKPENIKALKQFDKIDGEFRNKDTDESTGLEFILQSILLTDLYYICANPEVGDAIRTMILDNNALKRKNKTHEELEELKSRPNQKEYDSVVENVEYREILTEVKMTLREYADIINMDKLLVVSAFRFFESLENKYINSDMHDNIRMILKQILNCVNDKKMEIDTKLQTKKNEKYELQDVKYGIKDLEKTLSRFVAGTYISLEEIEEYRKKVNALEISLLNLPAGYTEVIYSNEELNRIALLSEDNLIYVAGKLKWEKQDILAGIRKIGTCNSQTILILKESGEISEEEIIELYNLNIINLDTIKELKNVISFSNAVSFEILNSTYLRLKEQPENKEFYDKYKKYIELYKEIYIQEKSEEELEENSNTAISVIIENFEGKEYDTAIKEYYKKGLITLDSIADWSNEALLIELYTEKIVTLEEIERLVNKEKLNKSHILLIYENAIWDGMLSQEERVAMLSKGWVSLETIEKLFRKNLIDKEDLRILVECNVLTEQKRIEIIEGLSLEEAEANSSISLAIDDNLQKIKGQERCIQSTNYNYNPLCSKDKIIISPNAREKFFELLGAKKVKTTKIDEDNPFYNYQFYIIPGKDEKIHLNSPVIAERYYEDKETERKFATENATYFFQYGDLMVLSNYAKKDEVVGKKENVVFRSNHTIANEKRKGNWASSVMGNVVRTLLSSDLKEYNSDNQKLIILEKIKQIYTPKQIMEILSLEEEIDSGRHLYEVIKENKSTTFYYDEGLR